MTALSSRFFQRAAAATALALTATSLVVAATPASAVSGTLSYDCTSSPSIPPGTHVFSAVIDTDAPATLGSGVTAPIKTTSTVAVPEEVADLLRAGGITYVSGSANATGTVDGVSSPTSLAIPNTPVPPDGTVMNVVGTGSSGNITGGPVGTTISLGAGNFTATLQGYNSVGPVGSAYTFTCTLQPSQNLLVDSVSVVKTPTTTTLTVATPVEYGAAPEAQAAVATEGSNVKPSGTVEFTFDGKSVKVDVKGGKAKATLAPALTIGPRTVTATFTPTDATKAVSQASKSINVVKGGTTTTAAAVYRDARNRLVGKALVEAVNATEVAGDVKFVLKRNGVKIRTAIVELNDFDKAKKVFKRIRKAGTYKVVARYKGSSTLKRSVDRVELVV